MKGIIVYGSQYGTTKQYAKELSKQTGLPIENEQNLVTIDHYDFVVYLGGLYAGGLKGFKSFQKKIHSKIKLIVVTVGLADVTDEENIKNIRQSLKRQIPKSLMATTIIYHLRGGIDYSKLNFKHKTMMSLLYTMIKKKAREKMSAEDLAMIETYHKQVNFVDFDMLKPIIKDINNMIKEDL